MNHTKNRLFALIIPLFLILGLSFTLICSGCADTEDTPDTQAEVTADVQEVESDVVSEVEESYEDGQGDTEDDTGPEQITVPEGPWPVTEPGYYNVGFTSMNIEYNPVVTSEPRELRISVWYPTLDATGRTTSYQGLFARPTVFDGASVAPGGPFPVLLFSHGNTSFVEQSFFMTEFFTSHGWIVAGPDHTGNTFRNLEDPMPPNIFVWRPQDISATIDTLMEFPEDHPLYGQSSDDIVLSGHSFGGYTTLAGSGAGYDTVSLLAACEQELVPDIFCDVLTEDVLTVLEAGLGDPRVKIGIPQAPGGTILFGAGVSQIDIPILLITGAMDRTTTNENEGDPVWSLLEGENKLRVDLTTGGHFTFSNACGLLPGVGDGDGCGPEFITPEETFLVVNAYSMAFARYHLWGDDVAAGLLDGTESISDVIELSHK